MHHILEVLSSPFRHLHPAALVCGHSGPLDHPSLINEDSHLIDDLPLPLYAVDRDGRVRLVGGN